MTTLVSIAFVLDCTASMGPWIHAAKSKIHEIVDSVSDQHPDAEIEIGLVAYRDYGDLVRFRVVDFTSAEIIERSLQHIHAEGGDDEAEDVAHALQRTTHLTWEDSELCLVFHITDAPAHGRLFHTPFVSDRFPDGDPEGLDPRDFISHMSARGFHYTFLKITSATDTMLDVFHNVWTGPGEFRVLDLTPQMFGPAISQAINQSIMRHTSSQDR